MNIKPLLCLFLAGCATHPVVQTVEVKVPVPVPCKVPTVTKPAWDIDAVPLGSSIYRQVKALLTTNEQHLGYESKLEAVVKSCQ